AGQTAGGDAGGRPDGTARIELACRLDRTACTLIRLGHTQVWEYPWDLFLTAIDEACSR
ncbi:MAG: hypothetical protein HQM01_04550, partial [Magnetococcales bacterium]|nr:hypothetical protein [Magnetococcales bacterium]